MAPATAPSSGRAMSFLSSGVAATRSSPAVLIVAMPLSLAAGEIGVRPGADPGHARLPDALGREVDHLGGVLLGDEARPGHHGAGRHQPVQLVQPQQLDRQVALQELLLVDREQHLALIDRLEHAGRQIEGAELDLVQHLDLLERRHGRLRGDRPEGEHAVDVGIGGEMRP